MKSILDFDINSLKLSSSVLILSVSSSLLQTSVFRFNFNFDIKILWPNWSVLLFLPASTRSVPPGLHFALLLLLLFLGSL
jgi:hypothetical protein